MASFSIQWRSSTKKDLRKLPLREVNRIMFEVESLAEEPFPSESALHAAVKGSAANVRIEFLQYYWILSYGLL